jgi:hypothetical protein
MSAFQSDARDAIGLQLVATLETYDADTTRMVMEWPDLECYRRVSEQVERIRMYSASIPELRVQWVELLIAHAELVHCLWRAQYAERSAAREQIENVRQHHSDAVAALRARCLRVIARAVHTRGGPAAAPA